MYIDAFGRAPAGEAGEHFRSSVQWWGPLADYLRASFPQETSPCALWYSSDGDGLDDDEARRLSAVLDEAICGGAVEKHLELIKLAAATEDRAVCLLCEGTGLRRDQIGVEMGFDRRDPVTGDGGCNGCQGLGTMPPFAAGLLFSREHVEEFAAFLRESGGFQIF